MNNEAVNQSLINIEENLRKLETARNQVNSVSEKSEVLVKEVSGLVRQIQSLQSEFGSEKQRFNSIIENTISEFEESLRIQSKKILEKSDTITSKHLENTDENIRKLKDFEAKIVIAEKNISKIDFEKGFSKLTLSQQTAIDEQKNFKLEINELIEKINSKLTAINSDIIENQKLAFDKLSSNFSSSLIELKENQQASNKNTLETLDIQNKKLNQLRNVLFSIIVVIILCSIITFLMLNKN